MSSCVKYNQILTVVFYRDDILCKIQPPKPLPLFSMNSKILALSILISIAACNNPTPPANPLIGTWELISATSTEKDSTVSTFNPNVKMIKVINPTHFAFFSHDLTKGADSVTRTFVAGAGTYTLVDSSYTEHLDYFIDRQWEGNTFQFTINITNDTLTQKGIEKVEKLGIDHIIVEKYKKVAKDQ